MRWQVTPAATVMIKVVKVFITFTSSRCRVSVGQHNNYIIEQCVRKEQNERNIHRGRGIIQTYGNASNVRNRPKGNKKAWNKTHNAKEIAECFSVNTSTVYRLEKQMRETGSVKTRTSQRGRKHALTPEDIQNIDRVVQQEPDITIDEIIDKLGLHVCNETVRKAVIKLGYSYKKKSLHASEQERPRCQGKTQKLEKNICRRET